MCKHLLLVYIAINNCDWQDATTSKWQPQPRVFVARSNFESNKRHWLWLTVNQVLLALMVRVQTPLITKSL